MGKGTISPALAAQIRAQRAQQRTTRDFTPTTRRPMADDVIGRVGDFLHRNRSAADDETLDYFHTDPATVGDLRRLLAVAEAARRFKVARAAVEEAKVLRESAQTTPSPNKGDAIAAAHRLLAQQTDIRDAALYELDAAVAALGGDHAHP